MRCIGFISATGLRERFSLCATTEGVEVDGEAAGKSAILEGFCLVVR